MKQSSVFQSVPKRYLIIPLVAVLLFIIAMAVFLTILSSKQKQSEEANILRQAEWMQKAATQKMMANQRFLFSLSEYINRGIDVSQFQDQITQQLSSNVELLSVLYVSRAGDILWSNPRVVGLYEPGGRLPEKSRQTMETVLESFRHQYSPVFLSSMNGYVFELHVPVYQQGRIVGVLIESYSLDRFLLFLMPESFQSRYGFIFYDLNGNQLRASDHLPAAGAALKQFELGSPADNMVFEIYPIELGDKIIRDMLLILVIGLSILVVFGFGGLLQHMQLRLKAEQVRDQFFNLSLDIFCVLYPDGRFHMVNPTFSDLLGYRHLTSRMSFFDVLLPEERATAKRDFALLISGQQSSLLKEYHCVCADGSEVWIEWAIQPDAVRHLYYAAAHDITMRKNRELDLEAEHLFQKEVENSMTTGVRIINCEGKIIYVNPAFCRMTGFPEESLLNSYPPYAYWHQEELDKSRQLVDQIMSGNLSMSGVERRFVRSDGSDFYAKLYLSPVTARDGQVSGWMTMFLDVTERKKAQKAIAGAYDQFMRVFDSLDLAVSVCGQHEYGDAEILFANDFYINLFGSGPEGHVRLVKEVILGYRNDKQMLAKPQSASTALTVMSTDNAVIEGEVFCDQTNRWFDVRIRQILWIDDRLVQLQHATDITERKLADDIYQEQQEKLEFNSRLISMGEMASSLAHELNQPLTAITNYAKGSISRLAHDQISKENLRMVLEKMADQADRAAKIIKRIRAFVQKSTPNRESLSLTEVIENAVAFAEIEARKYRLNIVTEGADANIRVLADGILIEQVIFNLLKNAIDAMQLSPYQSIRISMKVMPDNYVQISVADQGHGIELEANEDIYMAFYTTKAGGMGMGLNICRSIIEIHNGRIWYEPNESKGTVFHFTLPVDLASIGAMDGTSDRIYY